MKRYQNALDSVRRLYSGICMKKESGFAVGGIIDRNRSRKDKPVKGMFLREKGHSFFLTVF